MEKKRCLLIAANGLGKSGVPSVIMSIIRSLSDKVIFDIVLTREDYYYKEEFLSYGGNIYFLNLTPPQNKIKRIFWRLFSEKKIIKKELNKILSEQKYDYIHSFKEEMSVPYFEIAKKNGINNRIIHINRIAQKHNKLLSGLFFDRNKKNSISLSTKRIAVSIPAGESFFKKEQYEVIYNTYDENTYFFQEYNGDAKTINLLHIGTFLPLKNQLFLLDVVNSIKQKGYKCHLNLVGWKYDIDYYNSVLEKINILHLNDNVTVYNQEVNQQSLLENTIFNVLPSLNEGLSLTTIEAQACGIHCFVSDNVPNDVDVGNVTFLKLDSDLWANDIIDYYKKNNIKRKKANMTKFSNKTFKNKIERVYQ